MDLHEGKMLIDYIRHDRSSVLIYGRSKTQCKFAQSLGGVWSERLGGWLVSKDRERDIEAYNKKVHDREQARIHRASSGSNSEVSSDGDESSSHGSYSDTSATTRSRSPSYKRSRERDLERRISMLESVIRTKLT